MKPYSITLVAIALVLAACGKSSDNNNSSEPSSGTVTTTTSSPPIPPTPPPTGSWCQGVSTSGVYASAQTSGTQFTIGGQTVCKQVYNIPLNLRMVTVGSSTYNSGISVSGKDSITISSSGGPVTYLNNYYSGIYIRSRTSTFQMGSDGTLAFGSAYDGKYFSIYNVKIERCLDTANNIISCY